MYSKVVCFAALIVVATANLIPHSPAYSAVHVNKHDGHAVVVPVAYAPPHGHYGHGLGHGLEHGHYRHSVDYYTHPRYEFEYKVVDRHTGDIKAQAERRDGDVVRGYYALHQPDGSERSVHYAADDHAGFRANVRYGTHHLVPRYHAPLHH